MTWKEKKTLGKITIFVKTSFNNILEYLDWFMDYFTIL